MCRIARLQQELATIGRAKFKATGNSMLPILKSDSLLTYERRDDYNVKDIDCCKVDGHFIAAHFITMKEHSKGWLISNNHKYDNGWTRTIFGKVVQAEYKSEIIYRSD
jgi:hypothetical protein